MTYRCRVWDDRIDTKAQEKEKMMVESMCGCICSGCEFVEKCGCKGCFASKGYPFHGECKLALCCMERGYTHCGECEEFPCQKLKEYAYDPEYGDENGSRLEVLKQWAKGEV